jgi:7-cyano-7-deazaguanine reductase
VESKSFKLYLNSFNQSKFASWQAVEALLGKDLSACAGEKTTVTLYSLDQCAPLTLAKDDALCIDDIDACIEHYDYQPNILNHELSSERDQTQQNKTSEYLVSHLLKSNCLITNQPDWASIYIRYQGEKIEHEALLKYLVSFRSHNEFHEQCVERIFCDLQKYYQLEKLSVFARYTRRGGLDINPFRSTHLATAPSLRTIRQ